MSGFSTNSTGFRSPRRSAPSFRRSKGRTSVIGEELTRAERERLRDAIAARGLDYVGQEVVRLSTTPRWAEDRLEPRPFVLRVYCAATRDGWRVMPGGFCRISDRPDARAVTMGDGVESADVWVLAENPVEASSLLPTPENVRITRMLGNLPSRAADNLFWFGRYLERAEATLRVVRCLSARSVDPDAPMRLGRQSLERLMGVLVGWGAVDAAALAEGATAASNLGLRDPARYGSALSLARSARNAASVIRERLTHQTWELIGRLGDHDRSGPAAATFGRRDGRHRRRGADDRRGAVRAVRREFQSRRRLGVLRDRALRRARERTPAACSASSPATMRPSTRSG